jgi:cell division protein ZapE
MAPSAYTGRTPGHMKKAQQRSSVSSAYDDLVKTGAVESDPAQADLALRLDRLLEEIRANRLHAKSSALGWVFARKRRRQPVRGLYIHGAVGRGKSMLMDLFFSLAPETGKRRVHFADFMADAHARIHAQRQAFARGESGEADPMRPVGRALAAGLSLLCFDEFSVTDIADAAILARLFEAMFSAGVTIVATSNVHPDDLYRDGLNRDLFLPFLAILKRHCDVFELDSRTDFRLEKTARRQAYFSPASERNRAAMEALWRDQVAAAGQASVEINLAGRKLKVDRASGRAAWLTFDELCRKPRGNADYMALADRFDMLFLEGVPMMDLSMRNEARRFIQLVDILYDRRINAVILAQANPHALYVAGSGNERFEFDRTASRLIEMQSAEYAADREMSGRPQKY